MSRIGFLLVVASVWLGCGSPTAPKQCNFQTCNGCCDAAGECQAGFSPTACGVLGATCQACTGSVCQSGSCTFVNNSGGGGGSTTGGGGGSTTGGGGGSTTGGGGGTSQPGDTCNNPTTLSFDSTGLASFSGDNSLYANDGQGSCGDSRERIFAFVLATPTWVDVTANGLLAYHLRTSCNAPSSEEWCSSARGKRLLPAGTHYLWAEGSSAYSLQVRLLPGETCQTATDILLGGTTSTVMGTLDGYEHQVTSSCSSAGPDRAYAFTTSQPQNFTAALTQINGFAGRLVLQSLSGDCTSATVEDCQSGTSTNTDVTLRRGSLPAGRYVLWVKGNATGSFTLTTTLSQPVRGETCADAIPLTFSAGSASASGDTSTFFPDTTALGTCGTNGIGNDLVYAFTQVANGTMTVTVTPTNSALRPVVSVRSFSSCGTSQADVSCAQATSSGSATTFTANLAAGTYFLVVDSYGAGGPFTLTASQSAMSVTVSDFCSGATVPLISSVGSVTTTGSTSALASDYTSGTVNTCSGSGSGPDGVYRIQHPTNGTFTATITGTGASPTYRPIMYLRSTCTSSTSDVACQPNDSGNCTFSTGTLTATNLAAGTYYLIVDSCGASGMGPYSLTVTQ